MKKKVTKDETIAFRTSKDNKDYLNEIASDNDMKESQIMEAILNHYLQSGMVIMIVKEIKRTIDEKKNKK